MTENKGRSGTGAREGKRPAKKDPLSLLKVFDRLTVGPVELGRDRLVAPYVVRQDGADERVDLIFRYEEDVFDKDDPSSRNLADMIAAQLALNYGLFCKSIRFLGSFDDRDQRFLREMAENTAREIYVKKFLEPNPFLVGEAAALPIVRPPRFCRAELHFPGGPATFRGRREGEESFREERVAILSSGGKDSLLSYGLLNETGYEVHPVFCNESGRHWLTALNAYRHFRSNMPNTSRVWINSDRVFSWMLRRIPFVRRDFASVRSDEYPIRLWTVAIFLFGALPIVRKRGIGRLVIGDEFDTTHRTSHKGITHYDGLFDQSRFFDNALSRYFSAKKWRLSQFSILRPLSEMLIQKTLTERYPHLFEHQVSCHAAHTEGERVRPCGRCEKCRRIVGMLVAFGADPSRCGYSPEQVRYCLEALARRGVHQEEAGSRQLFYMLDKKKAIHLPPARRKALREHGEILKLRFDPVRSPMEGIPREMRRPLYRILCEHARGAARRVGRSWLDFDVFHDDRINRNYPFEKGGGGMGNEHGTEGEEVRILLGELTWPEAQARFREVDLALLPVGSIEQHGPHLPLDTDAFDADYLAREVAKQCSHPKPVVLPLIPYGVSYHHSEFSGTISIGNETLSRLVYEIGMNAAANGVTKLFIINGHGGNTPALNFAAQMINRDARIFVAVESGETSDVDLYGMIDTPNDVHAGEIETSTSLAARPELVRSDKMEKLIPSFSSRYLNFTSKRGASWYAFTKRISTSGVMGDPTKASAEKGERMWKAMIEHLVAFVEDLKEMTLDEIYQRRY